MAKRQKFKFKPWEVKGKKIGWEVLVASKVIGKIVSTKEATGRVCFTINGDPSKRTYRGKDKAALALDAANKLVKKHAKKPLDLVFAAWDDKPRASDQW